MSNSLPGPPFARIAKAAFAVIAITAATAAASLVHAEEGRLTDEQRAQMEQRFDDIRARLDLSEEQRAELEPVLRKNFEQRAEVMRSHGVSGDRSKRLSLREARALKKDLDALKKPHEAEVAKILDPHQMDEFRKIQEEMRDEMRERVRDRRS